MNNENNWWVWNIKDYSYIITDIYLERQNYKVLKFHKNNSSNFKPLPILTATSNKRRTLRLRNLISTGGAY